MKRFFLCFSIALLSILVGCSDGDILSNLGGGKKIYYTTIDGKKVQFGPDAGSFDAVLVSNTYDKDQGCLTFDEKVTEIGDGAFFSCENLASITIPESIVSLGEGVFNGCNNLFEFRGKYASKDNRCLIIDGCIVYFAAAGLKSYNIPDGVTSIGEWAFSDCDALTSVTIGNGVTSIGDYAFYSCSSLTSITIPDSVTSIGFQAFSYCESLTSVTIGNSVTEIGNGAFSYCSSLTSITIPNSVTSIGHIAFFDCTSLISVYCKATTPPNGSSHMFSCYKQGYMFINCKIYVPTESVEAYKTDEWWGDYADYIVGYDFEKGEVVVNEKMLIYYTSTDGNVVTPYRSGTFYFGANIISNTYADGQGVITFAGEVTKIGYQAFYNCSTLANITIPDSVTSIEWSAFSDCTSLTSITIPDSVTSIGDSAFRDCTSLTSVYCKPTTPPSGDRQMFNNNASGRKIYVPEESVEAYKNAFYWGGYADAIEPYVFE